MTVTTIGYSMVICGHSSDSDPRNRYRGRIEKVKFGVPLQEAFQHDIPATLLVLMLKVNKEGPLKKDIWRAPGNQAQVRKLTHIMQHGRLVNIANFSVYTAASVVKKFLTKLPGGIFGSPENEERLFGIVELDDPEKQRDIFCRIVASLPTAAQHLLVLLFGTFRLIADSAADSPAAVGSSVPSGTKALTRMNAEAIGVSVAPSLFHSCIHEQRAKIEDVVRFRIASDVLARVIKSFGNTNLFPRENYEYYAKITGRTLRVDDNWLFTFQVFPSKPAGLATESRECEDSAGGQQTSLQSSSSCHAGPSGVSAERDESADELAEASVVVDLGGPRGATPTHRGPRYHYYHARRRKTTDGLEGPPEDAPLEAPPLCRSTQLAESTKSLGYLEWVHEKQTRRMQSRSEWFLSPSPVLPSKGLHSTGAEKGTGKCRSCSSMEGTTATSPVPPPAYRSQHTTPQQQVPQQGTSSGGSPPLFSHYEEGTPSKGGEPSSSSSGAPGGVLRKRSWRQHYVRPKQVQQQQNFDVEKHHQFHPLQHRSQSAGVMQREGAVAETDAGGCTTTASSSGAASPPPVTPSNSPVRLQGPSTPPPPPDPPPLGQLEAPNSQVDASRLSVGAVSGSDVLMSSGAPSPQPPSPQPIGDYPPQEGDPDQQASSQHSASSVHHYRF